MARHDLLLCVYNQIIMIVCAKFKNNLCYLSILYIETKFY